MSAPLAERIRIQYGELPRVKSSFSATALGMFSNGWVWFVTDTRGELGVLPTFGPSTLLIRSRENMNYTNGHVLGEDPRPSSLPQTSHSPFSKTPLPSNMMPFSPGKGSRPSTPLNRSIHSPPPSGIYENVIPTDAERSNTSVDRLEKVGDVIYPLFCVPVYEHAWMSAGFGVWGKEDWLREFWTVLDWEKVNKAFDHARSRWQLR